MVLFVGCEGDLGPNDEPRRFTEVDYEFQQIYDDFEKDYHTYSNQEVDAGQIGIGIVDGDNEGFFEPIQCLNHGENHGNKKEIWVNELYWYSWSDSQKKEHVYKYLATCLFGRSLNNELLENQNSSESTFSWGSRTSPRIPSFGVPPNR